MDSSQWPQGFQQIGVLQPIRHMDEIAPNSSSTTGPMGERKARPQKDQALNCPRCDSTNTKFCYYNNYSLTQPRYFCKTCRRYWTEGGTLRNVPVGGGSRKNKRPSSSSLLSSSSSSSNSSKNKFSNDHLKTPPLNFQQQLSSSVQNPKTINQGQDLNLGFTITQDHYPHAFPQYVHQSNNNSSSSSTPSALELLSSSGLISRGSLNNSFVPLSHMQDTNTATMYSNGFSLQPSLSFSRQLDGRFLFPMVEVKQIPSIPKTTNEIDLDQDHQSSKGGGGHGDSSGYWSGMLGGSAGSW